MQSTREPIDLLEPSNLLEPLDLTEQRVGSASRSVFADHGTSETAFMPTLPRRARGGARDARADAISNRF
jgi:hypothetical protein